MPSPHNFKPTVLTFAATDPSSGAGLQADILSIAAMGAYPLSVVTAITIQDTCGVNFVKPLAGHLVTAQAEKILSDIPVSIFKLGVLGSLENLQAVAKLLDIYPEIPLVVDPVLASGRGDVFADQTMVDAYRELIFPRTMVLVPNSLEARRLGASSEMLPTETNKWPPESNIEQLLCWGCRYVLLTGTHEPDREVVNTLYGQRGELITRRWERLPGSYHGSGCTLASSLAAALALGLSMVDAVQVAQQFTWQALRAGLHLGKGQFLPDRSGVFVPLIPHQGAREN